MAHKKIHKKIKARHEAFLRYYNQGLSNAQISATLQCSVRTVCRWKNATREGSTTQLPRHQVKRSRPRKYAAGVFTRMVALKEERPSRSAPTIAKLLREEFPGGHPSESTIRKYLSSKGYAFKKVLNRQGYIKFEREKPNELWQVDIAGIQTVGHLGRLYLIAILDDRSRYMVAAQYFTEQTGVNVLKVLRDAVMGFGRPNEVLADNGTQFRAAMKEYESRFVNLLTTLGVKAIFARPHHPQSKGKLERWFGTVIESFLGEARAKVAASPAMTLAGFNGLFLEWVRWYNSQKAHRSLPGRQPPAAVYFAEPRVSRPLEGLMDWNQWVNAYSQRKVTKYNTISFKTIPVALPPGYAGCTVDLLELDDRVEVYHHDNLVCTHLRSPAEYLPQRKRVFRRIAANGTIQFKKRWITIDYKLAGKKVEVIPADGGKTVLIYLDKVLVKQVLL